LLLQIIEVSHFGERQVYFTDRDPIASSISQEVGGVGMLESELVANNHGGLHIISSLCLHAGLFHLVENLAGVLVIGISLKHAQYLQLSMTQMMICL
jgi:hypothetical protein